MAAVDCSKTPRSKSIKACALTLRPHEARKLAEDGRVLIVREIKLVQFGPSGTPGYDWTFRRGPGGVWEDYRTAGLFASKYCPFGPVGSPLWGREAWSPDHAAFYPNFPHVYKAYGHPAAWEIEGGRIYSDEAKDWFPFRWRSSTSMPRHASRFPRLRHESCEVVQGRRLMLDHPELGKVACEEDDSDTLARIWRHDLWAWCSLAVDLDRLEVADA